MSWVDGPATNHDYRVLPAVAAVDKSLPECVPRTRPPMYPTSPKLWLNSSLEKENVQDTSVRRFVAEEMREVPTLGHRIVRKGGAVFPGTLYGTSSLLEELESMLTYVECVTASLSHRTRIPIPPNSVRLIPPSLAVLRRGGNLGQSEGLTQHSLAMDLRDSSNNLLICFSELECTTLSKSDALVDIEKRVNAAASDVNIALDAIERRYRNHEVGDVQEFFMGNQQTLEDCRRQVRELLQVAQQILILRLIVKERDVVRAKKLFSEHQKGHSQEGVSRLQSSFLIWIEKKWIPAMEAWNRIVAFAHEQVETMDVSSVIAKGKEETFAQRSLISEILYPGETLSDLIREQLENPLLLLAGSFKKRHDCLEALRTAIATLNVKKLTEQVCALEELAATGELKAVADRKLLKEGKRLIISLQQVENLESALRIAAQVGESVTLFRSIHHANEILLHLGIAGDVAANKEIVAHCSTLLTEMSNLKGISPTEFIAKHVDAGHITIPHVPSQVWTTETTAAYQAACQCLAVRTAQELVRLDLERVLKNGDTSLFSMTGSTSGDDASNASSTNPSLRFGRTHSHMPILKAGSVEELRTVLKRASEVGLNCQLVQDGEAYLRSIEVLKLKIHFEAQLRVLLVQNPENTTFEDIYKKVYDVCMEQTAILPRQAGQKLRLRYQDSDGDCISIVTQDDWNVFITEGAPNGVCGSKLELFCDFPPIPHARVTDEVLAVSPASEEKTPSSAKNTVITAEPVETKDAKDTKPKVLPLIPQHRDGATINGTPNVMRLARSRSAGFALRSSDLSPRIRIPRRTALDDSVLLKPHLTQGPSTELTGDTKAKLIRKQSVAPRPIRRTVVENVSSRDTPGRSGRCRVYSVKVDSSSLETPKRLLRPRGEIKSPALTKMINATRAPTKAPPTSTVSSFTLPTSTPTTASGTMTVPSALGQIEVVPTKRWNDDDIQLELQTVTSVASTTPRPVISINKTKLLAKNTAAKLNTKKFSVTLCSKSGNNTTKETPTKEAPPALETPKKTGISVFEDKREWSADMFMQTDLCTVRSEVTTPPPSVKESPRDYQRLHVTSSNHPSQEVSAAGQSPLQNNMKEKAELLQRLKQLREENQKALKAAINQRRNVK